MMLSRLRHVVTRSILVSLHYSVINPYFTYGIVETVWGNTYDHTINPRLFYKKRPFVSWHLPILRNIQTPFCMFSLFFLLLFFQNETKLYINCFHSFIFLLFYVFFKLILFFSFTFLTFFLFSSHFLLFLI